MNKYETNWKFQAIFERVFENHKRLESVFL